MMMEKRSFQYYAYIKVDNNYGSCSTCNMHSVFDQKMYITDTLNNLIDYHIGVKNSRHLMFLYNKKNLIAKNTKK